MKSRHTDQIPLTSASTLDALFHERARRSPQQTAYLYYDEHQGEWCPLTWQQTLSEIARWQAALQHENLQPGDRVAIMLKNCPHWVIFDQAALGMGLVTVPLYTADRPENVAHVLRDSGAKLLLIDSAEHWHPLHEASPDLTALTRIVTMRTPPEGDDDDRLRGLDEWLPETWGEMQHAEHGPNSLATIVYTSGTTGKSKGVMLSHHNLLSNAWGGLQTFDAYPDDIFLSFLPLSHCLERMGGYVIPIMAGSTVAFARSVQQLQEDLANIRPTIIITVPRIFERIQASIRNKLEKGPAYARHLFELAVEVGYHRFEYAQGRAGWHWKHLLWPLLKALVADKITARLGGRMRVAVSGGAALAFDNARTFVGLGIPIIQGYGLSEASPVISVNRIHDNQPRSVGQPLPGVEVRLGDHNGLEVHGPNVMLGYWNNAEATQSMLTADGWLKTGDLASLDSHGRITITGRLKEIIVLNNGEKIPPGDIEAAILRDPLFEQVMVVGEGKPYLALLAVVNRERWMEAAKERNLPGGWPDSLDHPQARAFALSKVVQQMKAFPGYARIRRTALLSEPWTIENGLLTPTLKLKRSQVLERYHKEFATLYEGYTPQ